MRVKKSNFDNIERVTMHSPGPLIKLGLLRSKWVVVGPGVVGTEIKVLVYFVPPSKLVK